MDAEKHQVRAQRSAFRRALLDDARRKAELDHALLAQITACMRHFGATGAAVAAYSPLPSEPGAANLPDQVARHAAKVWLPISLPGGELAWALHGTGAAAGALGITEPGGARFNSNVLRSCALVLAPALAVDRGGDRLGKGAGYYDRALAGLRTPVAAAVFDEDVLDHVPHGARDVPVNAVITPSGFFIV